MGELPARHAMKMPSEPFDHDDKSRGEACSHCAALATTDVFADNFFRSATVAAERAYLPGSILRVCDSHAQQFRVGQRFFMYKNALHTGQRLGKFSRANYVVKAIARIGEEPDFGPPVPHIPTREEQYEAHYGHPKGSR